MKLHIVKNHPNNLLSTLIKMLLAPKINKRKIILI
jgi:hypothetical protein